MFALTHAAKGAAATETRVIFDCSKLNGFCLRIRATSRRISGLIRWASKFRISSLTPRLPKNFFMEVQETSEIPSNLRTAPKTSAIGSGGILKLRISFKCSALICPTAILADSRMGIMVVSSFLISACLAIVACSDSCTSLLRLSTSLRLIDASASVFVIISIAASAEHCASCNFACSFDVFFDKLSTVTAASSNFERPERKCISLVLIS
mmetsp:Transcript_6724/g.8601  ORF Transcript_6724/g.8601 Transcript_6724/m.8601 type:complete len:210 (-) Transcript_6724:101-730(-)